MKWKLIYEELLDPFTGTVEDRYFFSIFKAYFQHCQETLTPLSISILDIPSLPYTSKKPLLFESYLIIRNITDRIREKLNPDDLMFYNGKQTFTLLFPNSDKDNIKDLTKDIESEICKLYIKDAPILLKGGFAEFPADADNAKNLQECAKNALDIANESAGSKIIGYFKEKRANTRAPLVVETFYDISGSTQRLTCSRNVSPGGIMISGMSDLLTKEEVKLTFNLPNTNNSRTTVIAKTIWNKLYPSNEKMDMGLYFVYITDIAKEQIRKFITAIYPPIIRL